jgi:glycosyltransferase involved in cell wall biosynthesis
MKVYIDSYDIVNQNIAGGIQSCIRDIVNNINSNVIEIKTFDKWNDNIIEADILHFMKFKTEYYDLFRYAKSLNKKIVISTVSDINDEKQVFLKKIIYKCFPFINTNYKRNVYLFNNSDILIVQSEYEKSFLSKKYNIDENKFKKIPNAFDFNYDENKKDIFINKYKIKEDFILCIGRFDKNKNQLRLIKSLKNENVQIFFIGGPDSKNIDYYNECKNSKSSNMHFLGWIPNESELLESALCAAKVLVLPSINETFGNVLVEAANHNLNIVANYKLPILEYNTFNNIWRINPLNLKDIRNKTLQALNTPKNINQRNNSIDEFSWKKISLEYKNLYLELIKGQ